MHFSSMADISSCSDYRLNEFDGYEHPDWPQKRAFKAEIQAALKETQTKVVFLVTGMFLGWLFLPGCTCFSLSIPSPGNF